MVWHIVCIILLLGAVFAFPLSAPLSVLEVPASLSPYEFGILVGSTFITNIQQAYSLDSDLPRLRQWVNTSPDNRQQFEAMKARHQHAFPHLAAELYGMSLASNVSLDDVWLENLEPDLDQFIPAPPSSKFSSARQARRPRADKCSDAMVLIASNSSGNVTEFVHGHNEDNLGFWKPLNYIIKRYTSVLIHGKNVTRSWTSYAYAGLLAGADFSWTSEGMSITMNSVFPEVVNAERGFGQNFMCRALLDQSTPDDILHLLRTTPCFSGASVNVADSRSQTAFNVEVSATSLAVTPLDVRFTSPQQPNLVHFNHYEHVRAVQLPDPSSAHRMARYETLSPLLSTEAVTDFLGDQTDPQYPVYGDATHDIQTLATVVFDLLKMTAVVFVDNPAKSAPVLTFDMLS